MKVDIYIETSSIYQGITDRKCSYLLVESRWLLYYGHLAQPGEQSAHNRQVLGSNPRMSIIITAG